MNESKRARIAVLDNDHVLRVVRNVLVGDSTNTRRELEAFFAPEVCDLDRLWSIAKQIVDLDAIEVIEPQDKITGATVFLLRRGVVTRELIEASPGLRLIQKLGSHPHRIDLMAAAEKNVSIACLPRRTLIFAAEHVVLLMLALGKRLLAADAAVRKGMSPAHESADGSVQYNWVPLTNLSGLYGRTLGIIGMGEVGTMVAEAVRGLRMRVIYYSRTRRPIEEEHALGIHHVSLDDLLKSSDFVSLHLNNSAENESFMNASKFQKMRPTAFFINTSRGQLLDEDALYYALASGGIAGAGLDVHRREPRPSSDPFLSLPNVVLTPHLGGGSRLAIADEVIEVLENIRDVLAGVQPRHGLYSNHSPS